MCFFELGGEPPHTAFCGGRKGYENSLRKDLNNALESFMSKVRDGMFL